MKNQKQEPKNKKEQTLKEYYAELQEWLNEHPGYNSDDHKFWKVTGRMARKNWY